MRKLSIIILLLTIAFSAFAEGSTEVKRIPGKTTPKIYEFSENEQRELENSISILMAPGTLPEGFDDFTLTPEEARELVHCTPAEIQKAVKTIGDARLYMLVSGMVFNSSVHVGNETSDGRSILINNQSFDCGRWACLYSYLLIDDYDEVGLVVIRGSEKDLTVPEKCYLCHTFSWVKKDSRYCFFNMQGRDDEVWERIRVVDNVNDYVKQMPRFWGNRSIDFVYMYRSTPDRFSWNNYDLGEYEIKEAKNAKGYLQVLYKNPEQNWHFSYVQEPFSEKGIIQGKGLKMADTVITSSSINYCDSTYYSYSVTTGIGIDDTQPKYKYKDDEFDVILKCYDEKGNLTFNSFAYCNLIVNGIDYGYSKNPSLEVNTRKFRT